MQQSNDIVFRKLEPDDSPALLAMVREPAIAFYESLARYVPKGFCYWHLDAEA